MAFIPAYLNMTPDELWERVRIAEELLTSCTLCPRSCQVDRTEGEMGFCNAGDKPSVASWGPHFGEERPIAGRMGSGTIFFGSCNLGCIFCQNWTISHQSEGSETSFEKLASIMIDLQQEGCHNINLVTPTHQVPMILHALAIASENGLEVPLVYNCGGYEAMNTLRILDGIIDIYMPDFKYCDPVNALKYSNAEDYPEMATMTLKEMHRQVGDLVIDRTGIARRGLLVRHLVMPEGIAGTDEVVRFIADEISRNTYINIMDQYYPSYEAFRYPPLDRRITETEFSAAVKAAFDAGLKRIDGISS